AQADALCRCSACQFFLLALGVVGGNPFPDRTGQSAPAQDVFLPHAFHLNSAPVLSLFRKGEPSRFGRFDRGAGEEGERRRKRRDPSSRRILADFLIGAHAHTRSYRLLTLDERLYKAAFPTLTIETI